MTSSKRARAKARPAKAKKRAKPRAAALRARKDHVRRNGAAPAPAPEGLARTVSYVMLPVSTAVATAETMVRCSRPFAELPLRAARARTPSEMWQVHARFVQDVMSEGLAATQRFLRLAA
jgi:hypothetical protein